MNNDILSSKIQLNRLKVRCSLALISTKVSLFAPSSEKEGVFLFLSEVEVCSGSLFNLYCKCKQPLIVYLVFIWRTEEVLI